MDHVERLEAVYSPFSKEPSARVSEDFNPLFDLLADDAVFQVTAPKGTPIYGDGFKGKAAIVDYLTSVAPRIVEGLKLDRPVEFVTAGDRVVVLGAESFRLKETGTDVPNKEFATVIDFHEGLITRILHIEDLSEFVVAYQGIAESVAP